MEKEDLQNENIIFATFSKAISERYLTYALLNWAANIHLLF